MPVPGINAARLAQLFHSAGHGILAMFNMFSGGALSRFTVFALGIMPYISASIIVQLLSIVVPSLEALRKEGESGRRKIAQYTRYSTVALGVFQSIGVAIALQSNDLVYSPGSGFVVTTVFTLVAGTVFLMWLGEQISERGLGNGISIIIFAGIASGLPASFARLLEMVRVGEMLPVMALFVLLFIVFVTGFVVFVERGQRRLPIHYAKRQMGNKVYASQNSHLPLKINMSGVVPPIFASSIILFPATALSWFGSHHSIVWLQDIAATLSPGQPFHICLYIVAIIFFCFFYTALVFNPKETADNLKKSGAFVPGIRPGEQTVHYIDMITMRLTMIGSVYMVLVCLIPQFLNIKWNVPFYFGGTSLLIVVVVTIDFMTQIQTHIMGTHYDGLLRKAHFKGTKVVR